MKRFLVSLLVLSVFAAAFTACGGNASTSSVSEAGSEVSSAAPASESVPAETSSVSQVDESAVDTAADVAGMSATLSEAAGLGGTIDVSETDLKANGLDTENVVAFAGAESKMSSENGGIVMVFQMQPGTSGDMVTALEAFRDARAGDDRYAEFETARLNTADARIVEKGDLVIYAVSATGQEGGCDALDAAIEAL